jgi:hypothetical protein
MTDLGKKVDAEYGEGWDLKRTAATIVIAAGIMAGAIYGAMRSYTPVVRTDHRVEQRDKSASYEKRIDYVAVEK